MRIIRPAVAAVVLVLLAAACGSDDSSSPSTTTQPAPTPGAIEPLVVPAAPSPLRRVSDAEAGTGLLEPTGASAVPNTTADQLRALGFQRGWSRFFLGPDRSSVTLYVLAFGGPDGPRYLQEQFASEARSGKEFLPLPGVPGAVAEVGPTPRGNGSAETVVAAGRYAVIVTAGGPGAAESYRTVAGRVVADQIARLRAAQSTDRTAPVSTSSTQPRTSAG